MKYKDTMLVYVKELSKYIHVTLLINLSNMRDEYSKDEGRSMHWGWALRMGQDQKREGK